MLSRSWRPFGHSASLGTIAGSSLAPPPIRAATMRRLTAACRWRPRRSRPKPDECWSVQVRRDPVRRGPPGDGRDLRDAGWKLTLA